MCQRIKDTVESHFIGSWGCIARYSNNGSYSHLTFSNFTVDINFGKLLISVYKSYDKVFMSKVQLILYQIFYSIYERLIFRN